MDGLTLNFNELLQWIAIVTAWLLALRRPDGIR